MAVATAPERLRAAPAAALVPDTSAPHRRAVEAPGRRGPRWSLRRSATMSGAIVLFSLLMVVAASAYLTQGQVRLTRMQEQLTSVLGQRRVLEYRMARLSDPSRVVSEAENDGLAAPSKVTDLTPLRVPKLSVTPSTVPLAGSSSVGSTAAR